MVPGIRMCSTEDPSIKLANKLLDWNPGVPFVESIEKTLDYFLRYEQGPDA